LRPRDVYVTRRPPSARHFAGQRVRQAYDDVAQPWRLALFLPLLPTALTGARGRRIVATALAASVGLAEVGRRRGGGAERFPSYLPLLAPAWVLERSVCAWLAVAQGVMAGGVRYGDERLAVAAHSPRRLRRAAARRALVPAGGAEAAPVRAVAERLERRPPASAESDGAPIRNDLPPVNVGDREAASQEQRSVRIRDDHGSSRRPGLSGLAGIDCHARDAARTGG